MKQVWISINLFSHLSGFFSICLFVPVWLAAGLRQWVLNNMEGCAVSRRMLCSQQKLGSGWSCCRYTHTRFLAHTLTWAVCQTALKACIAWPRVAQHTLLYTPVTDTPLSQMPLHILYFGVSKAMAKSSWYGVKWCQSDVLQHFCVPLWSFLNSTTIFLKQRFLLSILGPTCILCLSNMWTSCCESPYYDRFHVQS